MEQGCLRKVMFRFWIAGVCFWQSGIGQIGYTETGKASYYADHFHGRLTASGEPYNKNDLTAAHRELAFGTRVKVINLKNGKSVIVRINDRGPSVPHRIIDLSRAAAEKIDMVKDGEVLVKIEVIGLPSSEEKEKHPIKKIKKENRKYDTTVYGINGEKVDSIHYSIQVGSFSNYDRAFRYASTYSVRPVYIWEKREKGTVQYKVLVGSFPSYEKAKKALLEWKKQYQLEGFVIKIKD
jgi:rare lipoprotein A